MSYENGSQSRDKELKKVFRMKRESKPGVKEQVTQKDKGFQTELEEEQKNNCAFSARSWIMHGGCGWEFLSPYFFRKESLVL
jgi:hypothetical protein